MDTTVIIQICEIVVLLCLSAFFSSAETALSTVNFITVQSLAEDGQKNAQRLLKVLNSYNKMLSTILIGNNVVNLYMSSLTTRMAMNIWGNAFVGIATFILTFVVLMFGEIIPKTWARLNSEKLSLTYAGTIYSLMYVLTPIIFLVDHLSNTLLRLVGINPARKMSSITERELRTYVDVSHEDGVIESEEREMIVNVFDFSDAVARDIMIPRIDMTTVDANASYDELLRLFREFMYTRIPVYENDNENIIGLVNIKDFILVTDPSAFEIRNMLRDAHYTYEYKKTADLMMEMREKRLNVAFVLNEYGSCVGMITLEDLLEEIVGEIRDEYDEDEEDLIREVDERCYLIEGGMKLDDINDALGTALESEDYDSIGGIVIEYLDRMPEPGDETTIPGDILLKVEDVHKNRITKVLMKLPEPEETEAEQDNGGTDNQSFEKAGLTGNADEAFHPQ